MKNLNIMLYVSNITIEINKELEAVESSLDLEDARRFANRCSGMIDSLIIMTNTLVCMENNNLMAEMCELTDRFMAQLLQAMCNVAVRTNNDEAFLKYARERDKYLACI